MATHDGSADTKNRAVRAVLSDTQYVALREEWCEELMFRRQKIHTLATWLAGAGLVVSAWLWKESVCEDLATRCVVSALAMLAAVVGVCAVWLHKVLHNYAARVLVRMNSSLGLYGTLLPVKPVATGPAEKRSTRYARAEDWGASLGGWEMYVYSFLLWLSYTALIAVAWLTPLCRGFWRAADTGLHLRLAIGLGESILLLVFILAFVAAKRRSIKREVEAEQGLAGVRVAEE